VTPLPVVAYVLLGLALGLWSLGALAAWARSGGGWRLVRAVAALAFGIDALRVLAWRTAEDGSVPAAVPIALVLGLAAVRLCREWGSLGGAPASAPGGGTEKPSGSS